MSDRILRAPFPWFGGKSRVADVVWRAFGNVPNYVEPFAGSLAVLLGRPHEAKIETVNDLDCMLANFWRAVTEDPDAVAEQCDWPVNEVDLHARHRWLVGQLTGDFRDRMRVEADYFDTRHEDGGPAVFMCGDDLDVVMCRAEPGCEYLGERLCDWPMGRGKTCDLPLCGAHARSIGDDRDLCPIHHAIWAKQAGGVRINPWPPRRSK